MKKLNFVVSLSTNTNDFQVEMAIAAQAAAERLGVGVQVMYAENDPIAQSQQLLTVVQSPAGSRPDGILFHPFGGTALPQVARAAVAAGIGVVVLNWHADYITELRASSLVPIFIYSSNHREIGHIQAQQFEALLPQGGTVLYIQGPSTSFGARERTVGMSEKKPENIQAKMLKAASWTEEAGYKAVTSWLRLSTAQSERIDLIAAQNDVIAIGAKKAFGEVLRDSDRERWMHLPFTGVDGLPKTGQTWVRKNSLTATIVVPPNTGLAIEALANAIQTGLRLPECMLTEPKSFPSVGELKNRGIY
jgi:ribose transport system substrate-binding protein